MAYFRYNKKGNAIIDTLLVVAVVTVLAVIAPLVFNVFSEIKPELVNDLNETNNTKAIELLDQTEQNFPSLMDGVIIFVYLALTGVAIVSAFFLDDHPIFFIFTIIILVFVVIAAGLLQNFYEELSLDGAYVGIQDNFPMTYWIMNHLAIVSLITGFLIVIALYAKSRG